jgi:hypothetical protein
MPAQKRSLPESMDNEEASQLVHHSRHVKHQQNNRDPHFIDQQQQQQQQNQVEQEEDEEEDDDEDIAADEYEDDVVSGEASDEDEVVDVDDEFARYDDGFKWQRVEKLCNEVKEFGVGIIDYDELASVYDFRIDKFQVRYFLSLRFRLYFENFSIQFPVLNF